ncbi:MAG: hypothetical protein ACREF7_01315, partial [Candidatus Saccharimonadales bacterium]
MPANYIITTQGVTDGNDDVGYNDAGLTQNQPFSSVNSTGQPVCDEGSGTINPCVSSWFDPEAVTTTFTATLSYGGSTVATSNNVVVTWAATNLTMTLAFSPTAQTYGSNVVATITGPPDAGEYGYELDDETTGEQFYCNVS